MLEVASVYKSFPTVYGAEALFRYRGRPPRRTVLSDINLHVSKGELFGLLGPNGAGKTTLLKLLATLSVPDSGRIEISGYDVVRQPRLAKSKIGLATSEERSFYFRLTGRENLRFFGALAGLTGPRLATRIDEVVELVDLGYAVDQRFGGYSSGMRQRMTVARALLADPDVLFLDEPTRAVDPVHAEELRRLIRKELVDKHGKTVVLATNLLEEAWSMCDRLAIVNHGRIVAMGPPQSLDVNLRSSSRYRLIVDHLDEALLRRARAIDGVIDASAEACEEGMALTVELGTDGRSLTDLMHAVASNGTLLRDVTSIQPLPVDVFRALTSPEAP